jgi:endogenous inhibitor of DNA gyrase (YacG/DUF329 family)
MKRKPPALKTCRICRAPTSPGNEDYPFCSAACRERDLGNWASETYRVAAALASDDELPDIAGPLARLEQEE